MTGPAAVLQVAVPAPLLKPLEYLPIPGQNHHYQKGSRVRVPLGKRKVTGIIAGLSQTPEYPVERLKPALELLDDRPLIPAEIMGLAGWVSDYYHHPVGEVYAGLLPTLLRQGSPAQYETPRFWKLTASGHTAQQAENARPVRQMAVLECLKSGPLPEQEVRERSGAGLQVIRRLLEKSWIEPAVAEKSAAEIRPGPKLNLHQRQAIQAVLDHFGTFSTTLLEGITGSGKTEVYLALTQEALKQDSQVLILVPEISLTPQLIQRFEARLGFRPAVLHSGLGDRARMIHWLQAADAQAQVVIGTRSAVFVPLPDLGLIIVDEEHDLSFKQQEGLRYSARDVAIRRAQKAEVPIVLGSATPSLESIHNALLGNYELAQLPLRAGDSTLPELQVLDVRSRPLKDGISPPLMEAISEQLSQGGQTLLFLNRRGFAPGLMCHDCGWISDCRRCDAHMTLHKAAQQLRCHHCGSQRAPESVCPDCNSDQLIPVGQGTEKIEQGLQEYFPDTYIMRIDRDTTRRKGALDEKLAAAQSGEAQILIGTQMLAKGHDFPGVGLVAILDGDAGLYSSDFRASERMAQLIIQVSGRAGRGLRKGRVVIQTHQPENPLLSDLISSGYDSFARNLIQQRRETGLPPCGYMALVRAESTDRHAGMSFLEAVAGLIRTSRQDEVACWGPVPAPMERKAGRYRFQLILQSVSRVSLHRVIDRHLQAVYRLKSARRVRWSVDVDPQDMT